MPACRSRAAYFAITSTSTLTGSPATFRPRVVTSRVCGIKAIEKPSSAHVNDRQATPSTVTEPFSTR